MPAETSPVRLRSCGTVQVYSLDRALILERLRGAAGDLRRTHPEIDDIQLVGSLARGEATPGSDADLLVILADSSLSFQDRVAVLLRDWPPAGISVDLLPFTRAEFEARLANGDPFITQLARERQVL